MIAESAEGFQVVGSKYKEAAFRDKKRQWLSKKARKKQPRKYYRGTAVKMGDANLCKRCVSARQNCLVYHSRWVLISYYYYFF